MEATKLRGRVMILSAILMVLVGICFCAISIYFFYTSYRLVSGGYTVDAVVVHLHSSQDGNDAAPIYEYTVDGETYTYESDSSRYPYPEVGEHVTLYYDPANPSKAREPGFMGLWLLPAVFCPGSLIMVLAGFLLGGFGFLSIKGIEVGSV